MDKIALQYTLYQTLSTHNGLTMASFVSFSYRLMKSSSPGFKYTALIFSSSAYGESFLINTPNTTVMHINPFVSKIFIDNTYSVSGSVFLFCLVSSEQQLLPLPA